MIITTNVTADKNPMYNSYTGNNTNDKVFLLSIVEAEKYFKNDESRKAKPTNRLFINYNIKPEYHDWWLRTPGDTDKTINAAFVGRKGDIMYEGYNFVDEPGIRPAMWVSLV